MMTSTIKQVSAKNGKRYERISNNLISFYLKDEDFTIWKDITKGMPMSRFIKEIVRKYITGELIEKEKMEITQLNISKYNQIMKENDLLKREIAKFSEQREVLIRQKDLADSFFEQRVINILKEVPEARLDELINSPYGAFEIDSSYIILQNLTNHHVLEYNQRKQTWRLA